MQQCGSRGGQRGDRELGSNAGQGIGWQQVKKGLYLHSPHLLLIVDGHVHKGPGTLNFIAGHAPQLLVVQSIGKLPGTVPQAASVLWIVYVTLANSFFRY